MTLNGPEHYREAERLLEEANHVGHEDDERGRGMITAAQVHATLALAAATGTHGVVNPGGAARTPNDNDAWGLVAGTSDEALADLTRRERVGQ